MGVRLCFILALTLILVGCGKSNPGETLNPSSPFTPEVYKSADDLVCLRLISANACELTEHGTTLLCTYEKQPTGLRVVATVVGTSQVLYYQDDQRGVRGTGGTLLLSDKFYKDAKVAQQEEIERENQRQRQLAIAQKEAQLRAMELAKKEQAKFNDSFKETRIIATIRLRQEDPEKDPPQLVITDVSFKYGGENACEIFFRDFSGGYYYEYYNSFSFTLKQVDLVTKNWRGDMLKVDGPAAYTKMIKTLREAMKAWEGRFSDTIDKTRWDTFQLPKLLEEK